jgi:putative transposase
MHSLTTALARRYGTIIAEDLDVAAMRRGMGRRAFRRTVAQAGIGAVRPTLAYKTRWVGGQLVVADRWFPSSKTHHGCGGYHADLQVSQRVWTCPRCGRPVDRNANAALNLRDWTEPATDRNVQRGGVAAPVPLVGDHGGQARAAGVGVRGLVRPPQVATADDTRTNPPIAGARNPEQGYQAGEP